jgi:hypothetical protein
MYISLNQLGSLVLDVSSTRIDASFVQPVGKPLGSAFQVADTFTILKQDAKSRER